MKILCVGHEWRGSDANGLFYALARQGVITNTINEHRYISTGVANLFLKILHRLIRPLQVKSFNKEIIEQFNTFQPNIVLIYKGAFFHKNTMDYIHSFKIPVVVFFPDVSLFAHGNNIPQCIPHYDYIFTTKSFGFEDLKTKFNYPLEKVTFIPHGFDPQIHRPLNPIDNFKNDVSFIGNFSPHKAKVLETIVRRLPKINMKIWGGTWGRYNGELLKPYIVGNGIMGDAYSAAINSSKINLAILSEKVKGASSGDLITSRTFHITGAGGFMLHQHTLEVEKYYKEGEECEFYRSDNELIEKIDYYLNNEAERLKIAKKGYIRAVSQYSQDVRAKEVIEILNSKFENLSI
ncbi:glycosyltransferase [Fulvivirga sp.]|uniref:CgeB family protein n=1 Tax=Fulvivirga sp. TaxID=1931237 RepID=UPI0032EF3F9E